MTGFITTIQLFKAEDRDYEKLNSEMERAFFQLKKSSPAVQPASSKKSEFNSRKNTSFRQVVKAVRKTGRDYSFSIVSNKTGYQ